MASPRRDQGDGDTHSRPHKGPDISHVSLSHTHRPLFYSRDGRRAARDYSSLCSYSSFFFLFFFSLVVRSPVRPHGGLEHILTLRTKREGKSRSTKLRRTLEDGSFSSFFFLLSSFGKPFFRGDDSFPERSRALACVLRVSRVAILPGRRPGGNRGRRSTSSRGTIRSDCKWPRVGGVYRSVVGRHETERTSSS